MPNPVPVIPDEINLIDFISHHAHDLRSPYNRIMGFSKVILKGQDGPLTDLQKEDLTTVYNNGVLAYTLVNGLVDLARLIASEKSFHPTHTPLAPILQQAVTQWKKFNPDREAQFTNHLPEGFHLRADEAQCTQALIAWLTFLAETIQPPIQFEITAAEEPGRTLFTLRASGKPNPAPSSLVVEMTGYIARGLVRLHGGELLRIEPDPQGISLAFYLPGD
jgi:signal transduction histidine kinase